MSRVIRIDAEVKRRLDGERKPEERNYNAAIKRLERRYRMLKPRGDEPVFRWPQ